MKINTIYSDTVLRGANASRGITFIKSSYTFEAQLKKSFGLEKQEDYNAREPLARLKFDHPAVKKFHNALMELYAALEEEATK